MLQSLVTYRARDLPSCIYEIPEIYITKKLQKLQAVKRQIVAITRNRFKIEQSVIDLL